MTRFKKVMLAGLVLPCVGLAILSQETQRGLINHGETVIRNLEHYRGAINFEAKGDVYEFSRLLPEQNDALEASLLEPPLPSYKGRVAILVHGFIGSRHDLRFLASFLKNHLKIGKTLSGYDHVFFYQYNTFPSFYKIGEQIQKDLAWVEKLGSKVDVYGHSMGGLVSRYWIEKLGAGRFVKRLITFGTPHAGVPLDAYGSFVRILNEKTSLEFSLKQMSSIGGDSMGGNEFLRNLNAFPPLFADEIDYYTLAGNRWQGFQGPVGELFHRAFVEGTEKAVDMDGVVSVESALSSCLESKSTSWKNHPERRKVMELTHFEIIGLPQYLSHNDPTVLIQEKKPFVQIQEWAKEWE